MDEPDKEDQDNKEKDDTEKKQSEDKPAEDGIKVSDVFLNMNLAGQKDQTLNSRKKDDDDEVDFDRDEDEGEVENVSEEPDTGNKVSNHTIIKRSKNQVNVSVKIVQMTLLANCVCSQILTYTNDSIHDSTYTQSNTYRLCRGLRQ